MDGRGEAAERIELAVHDCDAEMVERLRHRRTLAPAIGCRIIFVKPRHRFALLAAAGREQLAADCNRRGLVGDIRPRRLDGPDSRRCALRLRCCGKREERGHDSQWKAQGAHSTLPWKPGSLQPIIMCLTLAATVDCAVARMSAAGTGQSRYPRSDMRGNGPGFRGARVGFETRPYPAPE